MGCATSKDEPVDVQKVKVEAHEPPPSAEKWSMMESAEEKGFLRAEEEDSDVEAALRSEFPGLQKSQSKFAEPATWRSLASEIEYEEADFVLQPPWTLQQAHAFYYFLCQTDERRRNSKRPEANPSIPRRSVYEIVAAAYELYARDAHAEALSLSLTHTQCRAHCNMPFF